MQFNGVTDIYPRLTLVAMTTKKWQIKHKIAHNSANVKDVAKIVAPNRVFEVGQFNSVVKIYSRSTLDAMVTNRLFLDTKLAITRLI